MSFRLWANKPGKAKPEISENELRFSPPWYWKLSGALFPRTPPLFPEGPFTRDRQDMHCWLQMYSSRRPCLLVPNAPVS
jgi:hypothetical protein